MSPDVQAAIVTWIVASLNLVVILWHVFKHR